MGEDRYGSAFTARYHAFRPDCEIGVIRRSGGIGRRASLRGWCPQGRGGSSPPSDTLQVHALQAWDLGVFGVGLFTDTLQVHALQC